MLRHILLIVTYFKQWLINVRDNQKCVMCVGVAVREYVCGYAVL